MKKFGIIGAGVVGTAIGVILSKQGFELVGVYDLKPEATRLLVERTGCPTYPCPESVSCLAEILFITPCDTAINDVVDTLADRRAFYKGQIVVHMSGAQSSQVLDRAKDFGAVVVSVHPLQAFASLDRAIENLPGSVFSVEGDEAAYETAAAIVQALSGEWFPIDRKAKPLYHAGACVVSNYLVTLIELGVKLLKATGIPADMAIRALMPLIYGSIKNIENIGIPAALTGPIARGDLSTVLKHLYCMEEMSPELIRLYSWLGFFTAPLALGKGTIDYETMEQFQRVFTDELTRIGAATKEENNGKDYYRSIERQDA